MERAIQVHVTVSCTNCEGRGLVGWFNCSRCGLTLREVSEDNPLRCQHPPGNLTDNRGKCDMCNGTGVVDSKMTLKKFKLLLDEEATT